MKKILFAVFIIVFSIEALCQQDLTFYFLPEVPQKMYVNPAYTFPCKYYLGCPVLNSVHFNAGNTGFAYSDLVRNGRYDFQNVVNKSHRTDILSTEFEINWLTFGYRWKTFYFTFNVAEKAHVFAGYPRELLKFAWKGNAQFIGETAEFNQLGVWGAWYREYSLTVAHELTQKTKVGGRLGLLFGKAGTSTDKVNIGLNTDPITYNLALASDVRQYVSFPLDITEDSEGKVDNIETGDINWSSFLFNRVNRGFVMDLGATHQLTEKIKLAASILDVGFIKWRSDVHQFDENGDITYEGTGLGSNYNGLDHITDLTDSLENMYKFTDRSGEFTYWLPSRIYYGATYKFYPKYNVGGLISHQWLKKKLTTSVSLSLNSQ